MAYQFIHIEGYARKGSRQLRKGKGKDKGKAIEVRKWSAAEIAAEAERKPGSCPHVDKPRQPGLLYGCSPSEAVRRAEEWGAQAKDAQGRKLRSDGLCMLAGVVTLPNTQKDDWPRYREAVVHELRQQLGERLLSVVEHLDEEHPHLHFYAVPLDGERFEVLHPGRMAAMKKAQEGAVKGDQNRAFKSAMRAYQDDFSSAVAVRFGLTRRGPRRRRLTREQWQAEKAQAKSLAALDVPKGMGLSVKDVSKLVTKQRRVIPDLLETDAEQTRRLNGVLAKRLQPLLIKVKNAESAIEQASRLADEVQGVKAENEALRADLALFTPEELKHARMREQQRQRELHEAEQMRQLESAELSERIAHNMCEAGEALDLREARERVEELVSGGYQDELRKWLEWKPSERPPEPLQRAVEPLARGRDDGPEFGR